jgi:cytochrome c oxidase subunit IV
LAVIRSFSVLVSPVQQVTDKIKKSLISQGFLLLGVWHSVFDHYTNQYARWIRVLAGVVLAVGIISGVVLWMIDERHFFLTLVSPLVYSIVSSILMYGFAEIIEILYRIYQRFDAVDSINRSLEHLRETK